MLTCLALLACAAAPGLPQWDFTDNAGGWEAGDDAEEFEVRGGSLHITMGRGSSAMAHRSLDFALSPGQRVDIRIKGPRRGEGRLLWSADAGRVEWPQRTPIPIKGGAWETVTLYPFWQNAGRARLFRFDLFGPGAFEIDWIRIRPWDNAAEEPGEELAWSYTEQADLWEAQPSSDLLFPPPFEEDLGERRYVTVSMTSDVDYRSAVVFAARDMPHARYLPFEVIGDGAPRTYNIELVLFRGRNPVGWMDPIVALGIEIPQQLRNQVMLGGMSVNAKPQGPPLVTATHLGLENAVPRAGRPEMLLGRLRNIGGTLAADIEARLRLPEGLRLADGGLERTISISATELARDVRWPVVADEPGVYPVVMDISGEGAVRGMEAELRFEEPLQAPEADYVPKPQPVETTRDVFMYYFPGWEIDARWDCVRQYAPERRPWLGYYDERRVDVVDWQIKAAVENGISGFVIDWYWREGETSLNHWVEAYDQARYRDELEVFVMWCNHIGRHTHENMQEMTQLLVDDYFTWPSYRHIDGKPVVGIWDSPRLRSELGGNEEVRRTLDACEAIAREAGFGGIYWMESGMTMLASGDRSRTLAAEGYDAVTTYHNWWYAALQAPADTDIPFEDVVETAPLTWEEHAEAAAGAGLTYLPIVESGWDPRPWHGEHPLVTRLRGRTPALFEELLAKAKTAAAEDGPPFVLLGPANEWGEGSYIEPCAEFGFGMYEAVRRVFGKGEPEAWPVNVTPRDVGLGPYEFPPLPSRNQWDFSQDAEGWAPHMGVTEYEADGGNLRFRTTTADPAIGINTHIDTSLYSKAVIRMKLSGGDVQRDRADFYWALPSGEMRASTSAGFPVVIDGEFHTYEAPLAGNAFWRGETKAIRFDPCNHPDVEAVIDLIRLE